MIVSILFHCQVTNSSPVPGTIQSYNLAGGRQLASQNYKNCIRQEEGYCCIQYSVITYNMGAGNADTITTCANNAANRCSGSSLCTTDYIIIPQGGFSPVSPASDVNYDRYQQSGRDFMLKLGQA